MFIGNFSTELINREQFHGTHWHGIVLQGDVVCFEKDTMAVAFWGVLYNKKKFNLNAIDNDAQVVAILFEIHGLQAFGMLDGSFTFIIKTPSQTMVVRDHHGTGLQLYYSKSHYASSLALLEQSPDCPRDINGTALATFLEVGYIPTGSSAIKGITKLAAGTMLCYENGIQQTVNLFPSEDITPAQQGDSLDDLSQQYGLLHQQAISRRIGQSRKVGILLSGGYDSGGNLAALRQIYNGEIDSYSIGFKGNNWSELPLAQCMADRFGTHHHSYEIDGSEILQLPKIVSELGDPFVEGGLMVNYAAMKMVGHKQSDVILGGDGSDQYFGTSSAEIALHYLAHRCGVEPLLNAAHTLLSHEALERDNATYRVRFHLGKIINILRGDLFGFEPFQLRALLQDQHWMPPKLKEKARNHSFEELYTQHAYHTDIELTINQVILFKASRMAQMFGQQITFPYMDLELYNFLKQLPVSYKCKGDGPWAIAHGESTAKFLLKYHYKAMLPTQITAKKKQGGFAPMPIFFRDTVQRGHIADFIMQSSVVEEFLNRTTVEKFIKSYEKLSSSKGNWFWYQQNKAIQYFNLLTIALWWEQHIKNNTIDSF
ncbi:MAG: asparagine synthase-related protein [Mucinivorans sp.]